MIIPLSMKTFLEGEEIDFTAKFISVSHIDNRYMVELRFYDTNARRERTWTFHSLVLATVAPYEGVGRIAYRDGMSEEGRFSARSLVEELTKLLEEK